MTVRLRAHHLLCALSYVGKGYSPAFVANFDAVLARVEAGEPVEIVAGPDDICAPRLSGPAREGDAHCRESRIAARDRAAAASLSGPFGGPVGPGARIALDAGRVRALRAAFAAGTIRRACAGCDWRALCGAVAQEDFAAARLFAPARDGQAATGQRSSR